MWIEHNCNPRGARVGDCVIRTCATALGQSWDKTYREICEVGFKAKNIPSANSVWGEYIRRRGFERHLAPEGITVAEFARENPRGIYILATDGHVVALIDGCIFDTWDSGGEILNYFWRR